MLPVHLHHHVADVAAMGRVDPAQLQPLWSEPRDMLRHGAPDSSKFPGGLSQLPKGPANSRASVSPTDRTRPGGAYSVHPLPPCGDTPRNGPASHVADGVKTDTGSGRSQVPASKPASQHLQPIQTPIDVPQDQIPLQSRAPVHPDPHASARAQGSLDQGRNRNLEMENYQRKREERRMLKEQKEQTRRARKQ